MIGRIYREAANRARRAAAGLMHLGANRKFPLDGFSTDLQHAPLLERLSDRELQQLNSLLPWHCFIADARGRRFGKAAWSGKRAVPQPVPDARIALMNECFDLPSRSVLEIGCFEGIHTAALSRLARSVIAVDARIDNVVKTIVRCAMLEQHPTVLLCDVERYPLEANVLRADVCHHVGVLYHLRDPVRHLAELSVCIGHGLFLDTHVADERDLDGNYTAAGQEWRFKEYKELGARDPFSGMYDHAKWLSLSGLQRAIELAGFSAVEVLKDRDERNGRRVLIAAWRSRGPGAPTGRPA